MSAQNGQRARFHRNRKRRIVLRMRLRTLMQELVGKRDQAATEPARVPGALRAGPARRAKA